MTESFRQHDQPRRSAIATPRFSIATLLVAVALTALVVSQISMMRQVRESEVELTAAREEVDATRSKFGSSEVLDDSLIQISRVAARSNCYRMYIPNGQRLLLHLTETEFPNESFPKHSEPSQTLSMNSWRDGADVLFQWKISKEEDKLQFRVLTNNEELFDYTIEDWKEGPMPNSVTYATSEGKPGLFSPDENIYLMKWHNDSTRRGVMLWLEPSENRYPSD